MKKNSLHTRNLCMIGLFTAVIAIMAQIIIPMPFGVPMTMQTFAITLAGIILGSKHGAVASIIYVAIGTIGLPVFAGFTGGWQSIVGPTGGFILSFPIMAYIIGLGMELRSKWKGFPIISLFLGTALNLLCGTGMFCLITGSDFLVGLATCVVPFIPASIIKAVFAYVFGFNIRKRLQAFL